MAEFLDLRKTNATEGRTTGIEEETCSLEKLAGTQETLQAEMVIEF